MIAVAPLSAPESEVVPTVGVEAIHQALDRRRQKAGAAFVQHHGAGLGRVMQKGPDERVVTEWSTIRGNACGTRFGNPLLAVSRSYVDNPIMPLDTPQPVVQALKRPGSKVLANPRKSATTSRYDHG